MRPHSVPSFTVLDLESTLRTLHDVFTWHKQKSFEDDQNMSAKKSNKTASLEQIILRFTRSGNLEEFRVYLKVSRNEILNWKHPRSGETCLLLCARYGHTDMLRSLSEEYNESLEQWNNDGKRALHEAALGGHLECVKYLISRNVEIDCLKRADWLVMIQLCINYH